MKPKRILIAYENNYGKMHEIADFWIDDYTYQDMLAEDVNDSLEEFLDTKGVFRDEPEDT